MAGMTMSPFYFELKEKSKKYIKTPNPIGFIMPCINGFEFRIIEECLSTKLNFMLGLNEKVALNYLRIFINNIHPELGFYINFDDNYFKWQIEQIKNEQIIYPIPFKFMKKEIIELPAKIEKNCKDFGLYFILR